MLVKEFKVFRRSENTNSFGLRGLWLISLDCEVLEVGANHLYDQPIGTIFYQRTEGSYKDWFFETYRKAEVGKFPVCFEIPERKPSCPTPELAQEIWDISVLEVA